MPLPGLTGSRKYMQGTYMVKNPNKYVGGKAPIYRSSWEHKMMLFFDTHPSVLYWSSESLAIPYINPFTRKISNYYPDFLAVYVDKNGKQKKEIIEIKPQKETTMESAKSQKDKIAVALNYSKWLAAKKFCEQNGMIFRVLGENDIFGKK
jgi:TnsA-like endonuclease N terminal